MFRSDSHPSDLTVTWGILLSKKRNTANRAKAARAN